MSASGDPTSPSVSVHLPTYNQVDYVAAAIESAVNQDYENLEVLVCDDGSTDGTAEVVQDYQRRQPDRVVAILNSDNVGLTRNFNRALRACGGELICFLAGDDLFLPGKVRAQVDWFRERPSRVLCAHQAEVFYDDGSRPPHNFDRALTAGYGAGDIIRRGPFAGCSVMVRADRIPPYGFDERVIVSDFMLWVDVLKDDGEFGFVPDTYARYRQHSANITADIASLAKDTDCALQIIEERYPEYAAECRIARARRVDYALGVQLLRNGKRKDARDAFVRAIRLDPTFAKPWVRAMQTIAHA